jgi:hypothetical protein
MCKRILSIIFQIYFPYLFSIGIALYFLYLEVGIEAIFIVGTPIVCLSIILTLYYKSQQINRFYLKIEK